MVHKPVKKCLTPSEIKDNNFSNQITLNNIQGTVKLNCPLINCIKHSQNVVWQHVERFLVMFISLIV